MPASQQWRDLKALRASVRETQLSLESLLSLPMPDNQNLDCETTRKVHHAPLQTSESPSGTPS